MTAAPLETDRLALLPLEASVEARADGRVILHIELIQNGQRKLLSLFLAGTSELGSRDCAAIAGNIARRINRDSSLLTPEA